MCLSKLYAYLHGSWQCAWACGVYPYTYHTYHSRVVNRKFYPIVLNPMLSSYFSKSDASNTLNLKIVMRKTSHMSPRGFVGFAHYEPPKRSASDIIANSGCQWRRIEVCSAPMNKLPFKKAVADAGWWRGVSKNIKMDFSRPQTHGFFTTFKNIKTDFSRPQTCMP